jgi:hypothetical protein
MDSPLYSLWMHTLKKLPRSRDIMATTKYIIVGSS